jgi:hypothetical protein
MNWIKLHGVATAPTPHQHLLAPEKLLQDDEDDDGP